MEKVIKTKINKDAVAVETRLELDFTGVSESELHELAARSIIIAVQSTYRIAGTVPTEDIVDVHEFVTREKKVAKATPESIAKKVGKMSPEERFQLLKLLGAE